MQKIFRLLLVAATILLGGFYFVHWSRTRALNNGEVHVRQQTDDKAGADASAKQSDSAAQPTQNQEMAANSAGPSGSDPSGPGFGNPSQNGVATLPASETITRNPPNGVVAAGSGKFQLYRQGDMTFRLNTESGQACVLFATDAQWRKPLVYDHGCSGR